MPDRIAAIHQPNFFPWLGYFDKINKADVFILLDNVQFPKTGGTWMNRVKIITNSEAQWLTAPIIRNYHGLRLIKDMEINNLTDWREKMLKTIEQNYGQCPFFKEERDYLQALINYDANNLCEYNIHAIRSLAERLGLKIPKLIIASTLKAEGEATDLLISLTRAVGGIAYLCGGGADGYQEDEKFAEAGIELVYQNFKHPVYLQANTKEFIAGLSIIDVLFNCGFEKARDLICSK
ncbi:MAG: WbqC family protein [Planctomycetota bacterium]